jgi:hypothetical protein
VRHGSRKNAGGAVLLTDGGGEGVRIAWHVDRCGQNNTFILACAVTGGHRPAQSIRARHRATLSLPDGPPLINGFQILNKPINLFSMQENRKQMWKNLEKFLEIGNPISNTFCYCIFFQISTNFELIKRF